MSNAPMKLTDGLLRDALAGRAAGPAVSGELAEAVLVAIGATSQRARWGLGLGSRRRPLIVFAAVALLLSAVVGLAAVGGGKIAITVPGAAGDIAFVHADYAWDGSLDWNGAATPTAGEQQIFRVSSEGGTLTLIADVPATSRTRLVGSSTIGPRVQWSPDGSRLAFRRVVTDPGIYVVGRDGTGMTRLTNMPEGWPAEDLSNGGFAWSPDGTRIAFRSPVSGGSVGGSLSPTASLYVVDASPGVVTKLAPANPNGVVAGPIAWSPDGTKIAFGRTFGQVRDSTNSLVVMDADGTNERILVQVTHADLWGLAWSPDGTSIVFARSVEYSVDHDGGIWIIGADGSGAHRIQQGDWSTEIDALFDGWFEWSPDGRFIATGEGTVQIL